MSRLRMIRLLLMVLFGLLLILLISEGSSVELLGVSVPVWVVALIGYGLGWGATATVLMKE